MKRICLITCYMGPLPVYYNYFATSCKQNSSIDFIVINDTIDKSCVDENIRYIKANLNDINRQSSQACGEKIELKSAWKINELKPLFGVIFEDELKSYDYWGWCDLDIIWGDLRSFLSEELLNAYDLITSKLNWTAGHFTLLKNNKLLNTLYLRNENIISLLNDSVYFAFEECCHRWDGKFEPAAILKTKGLPVSMFDIVKVANESGELRALFKELVREYPHLINYLYNGKKLIDKSSNEEFMYYHLITVKKIWRFFIPPFKNHSPLVISPYGIRATGANKYLWVLQRAVACLRGIKKSTSTQKPAELLAKIFR